MVHTVLIPQQNPPTCSMIPTNEYLPESSEGGYEWYKKNVQYRKTAGYDE